MIYSNNKNRIINNDYNYAINKSDIELPKI